jgi:hypothetical protein
MLVSLCENREALVHVLVLPWDDDSFISAPGLGSEPVKYY